MEKLKKHLNKELSNGVHWLSFALIFLISASVISGAWGQTVREQDSLVSQIVNIGEARGQTGCDINVVQGQSIQAAINAANSGDVICVGPGMYYERIEVSKSGSSGNPIIIKGTRDSSGLYKTIIDGGDRVTGWTKFEDTSEYTLWRKNAFGYEPGNMVIDVNGEPQQIPEMGRKAMDSTSSNHITGTYDGFDFLRSPTNFPVNYLYAGKVKVNFWEVFNGVWGYKDGYAYLRFKNKNINPNIENVRVSPQPGYYNDRVHRGGAVVSLINKSYVTIKDFKIQGGAQPIWISGAGAHDNIIENNYLQNGTDRVHIKNQATNNKIIGNIMTTNLYSDVTPGVYYVNGSKDYALKQYIYGFYKHVVSDAEGSEDRQVYILNAGSGNEIGYNSIHGGLIGVSVRGSKGTQIYNNNIFEHSSGGVIIDEGTGNTSIYDNLLADNGWNMRWHNLFRDSERTIYVYRNRFWQPLPASKADHIFVHTDTSGSNSNVSEIYLYQNSFSGGGTAFNAGAGRPQPDFHFLNNIFSSTETFTAPRTFDTNAGAMGTYDYNWMGGSFEELTWDPVPHNIQVQSQYINGWHSSTMPDFTLSTSDPVLNKGLDLSRDITLGNQRFANGLPGMSPGYGGADGKPDLGALQFGEDVVGGKSNCTITVAQDGSRDYTTIQAATDATQAGDVVCVKPGTYNERIQITRSGSSDLPIIFQAQGQVINQGFTIEADYIHIDGFEITDTPNAYKDGQGVWVVGKYCEITNNYIHDVTRWGILLFANPKDSSSTSNCLVSGNRIVRASNAGIEVRGQNNIIENNDISHTIQHSPKWIPLPDSADADGIRFFGKGHIIRGNYIHDITFDDPENIDPHIDGFQTFAEGATDILIEGNYVDMPMPPVNTSCQYLTFSGSPNINNITIRNNVFTTDSTHRCPLNVRGLGDNIVRNINILNNTFIRTNDAINNANNIIVISADNVKIKNNIFYYHAASKFPYLRVFEKVTNLDVGNNLVYTSQGLPSGNPYNGDLWQADPQFVDFGNNDFSLLPTSPAINAGILQSAPTTDIAGNLRDSQPDIGAYEYGATGLPRDGGQPDPDNNPTPPNPNPNNSGILSPDLNCDNKVNVIDFGILLSWWGPYNGGYSHPNCNN